MAPTYPRRSSTLFEKSSAQVLRLARKLSLAGFREKQTVVRTVASNAQLTSQTQQTHPPQQAPDRPKSRLSRWRSRVNSEPKVQTVVEEEDEELMRSTTPRGFVPNRETVKELAIRFPIPKAKLVRGGGAQSEYDISALVYGRKSSELWSPTGDVLIYLCSKSESSHYQPSFKLPSAALTKKSEFFVTALSSRWQEHSPAHTQILNREGAKYILYFPPWETDTETTDSRNCDSAEDLAELTSQLVATHNFFSYICRKPPIYLNPPNGGTLFQDLMDRMEMYILTQATPARRSEVIKDLEIWIRDKRLDDPRLSAERIMDSLLISERYQWKSIYEEAFIHAAGRYDQLISHPSYSFLSPATRQILERACYFVKARVSNTTNALDTLQFPLFTQQHSSRRRGTSPSEIPPAWRKSFQDFRKFVQAYYSSTFKIRNWPPAIWTRGMVMQIDTDFSALYNLLLDQDPDRTDRYRHLLLQQIESYSSELPRLPELPPEGSSLRDKRQSRESIGVLLMDSYNLINDPNLFVEAFKEMEREYGTGRTVTKSVEAREGRWCLVVAVLDAVKYVLEERDDVIKYGWGVEYWLCAELPTVPPWNARSVSALSRRTVSAMSRRSVLDREEEDEEDGESDGTVTPTNETHGLQQRPRNSIFG